jgi:hypothetical protein
LDANDAQLVKLDKIERKRLKKEEDVVLEQAKKIIKERITDLQV